MGKETEYMRDIIEEILESSSIEKGDRLRARLEEIKEETTQKVLKGGENKGNPSLEPSENDSCNNVPNYVSRRWLNRDDSASTGNVVAFDGYTKWHGTTLDNTFLSVSDCYQTIRLHPTENDSKEDFINKMTVLRDEIDKFITHLKQREEDDKQE